MPGHQRLFRVVGEVCHIGLRPVYTCTSSPSGCPVRLPLLSRASLRGALRLTPLKPARRWPWARGVDTGRGRG